MRLCRSEQWDREIFILQNARNVADKERNCQNRRFARETELYLLNETDFLANDKQVANLGQLVVITVT